VVLGWVALALVLVGAMIGATASVGSAGAEREALEAARRAALEARTQAGQEARRADELGRALKAQRGQVVRLRRELRSARRDARRGQKRNRR